MKRFLPLFYLLSLVMTLFAAPHNGDLFNLKQPDGSSVEVLVWGDEFYQRIESPSGYTLIRDEEGWITYADVTSDGEQLISTGERYNNSNRSDSPTHGKQRVKLNPDARLREVQKSPFFTEEKRSRAGVLVEDPVLGDVVGLTILVDFSDQNSSISEQTLENFLNQKGFNGYSCNGSVRDYYGDVSGGKVDYTNIVTAFYRAKKPKSYYDANEQAGQKAIELIKEAVNGVKNEVDFSKLTQRQGAAIALNILYAGEPTWGWAKGLWPHQFQLNNYNVGGYTFNKYQMTNIGSSLKLSTFCHENGHMVGQWPDLYDYQSDGTGASGIGHYGLMCFMGDSKNPTPPNCYFRYLVGWDELTDITDTPMGTLLTLNSNGNEGYIYKNSYNKNEFFVIESREQKGRNASLPSEGVMIWHVDAAQQNNDYEQMSSYQHYMVSLEQADGQFSLEKRENHGGDAGDLFNSRNGTSFSDETFPDANWWNGSQSGLHIGNISAVGSQMTFTIGDQQIETHTITASAGTGGSISPNGSVAVADGENQTFVIDASEGFIISDVLVNDSSKGAITSYTFSSVTSDQTIRALFEEDLSLSITSPNGGEEVALGKPFTITWSGEISGSAGLLLLEDGRVIDTISTEITGNEYVWDVPDTLAESNSYTMKIYDERSLDESDSSFTIKEIIISDNLVGFADWYVVHDTYSGENGSSGELDTTGLSTENWIGADFSIGKKDDTKGIYPYASLVAEVKEALTEVTAVAVTYKADADYTISLNQEGLDTLGESYIAKLPMAATQWNSVILPISAFDQPDWVTSKTGLDLSKVLSLSLSIDDQYNTSSSIKVKNIQLYGYVYDPVAIDNYKAKRVQGLAVHGISKEKMTLNIPKAGSYKIELFNLTGRRLYSTTVDLQSGMTAIPFSAPISSQITILRISGMNSSLTSRALIQ